MLWPSSSSVSVKLEALKAAERRLIELAKSRRFDTTTAASWTNSSSNSNSNSESRTTTSSNTSTLEIEPFDTKIPQSVVPLRQHSCSIYNHGTAATSDNDDNNTESSYYRIHGLRVFRKNSAEQEKENTASSSSSTSTSKTNKDNSTSPLVLLHGYMNGCAYFYRKLAGLSRYFTNIYSLDLLGWGLSSRPRFDLATMHKNNSNNNDGIMMDDDVKTAEDFFVESLEAWREKNQIDRMVLAGHSMGGYVSVAYCERYPQHVERLILISPAGVNPEPQEVLQRRRAWESSSIRWRLLSAFHTNVFFPYFSFGNLIRTFPSRSERMIGDYVRARLPSISDPHEQSAITEYLFMNSALPGSGEHSLSKLLTPFAFGRKPTETRIPNLRVPHVSFLYGETDWMDVNGGLKVQALCEQQQRQQETQQDTAAAAAAAPTVDVYRVSSAGHLLMLDNWQEFNSAMGLAAGYSQSAVEGPHPTKLLAAAAAAALNENVSTSSLSDEETVLVDLPPPPPAQQQPAVGN